MVGEESTLPRKTELCIVWGVVVVGFLLRFFYVTHQSLWYDELFNVSAISQNFSPVLKILWEAENHPPLYIILLKGWVGIFGLSDLSMRGFSVVAGTLLLFYLYKLIKTIAGQKTALIALMLSSVSPLLIYYSQEVRNFSVWLLFSTASFSYFFERVLLGKKRELLWTASTILALYTHIFSIFILPVQLLLWFVITFQKKEKLFTPPSFSSVLSMAALLMAIIPLVLWALGHKNNYAGFQKEFSFAHILYLPFAWTYGFSLGPSINELHTMTFYDVCSNYLMEVGGATLSMLIVLIAGIWAVRRNAFFMWIAALLIIISGLIVSTPFFSFISFNVRSSLFLFPFFLLFLAIGIQELWKRTIGPLFPSLMIGFMLLATFQYFFASKYFRDDLRGAIEITKSDPETKVFVTGLCTDFAMHYYGDKNKEVHYFNNEGFNQLQMEKRVWVLWNRLWLYNNRAMFEDCVHKQFKTIREENLPGIKVELFEREQ
jgi:uncharacterized membrane protein